jgi:hypothetical protein
MAGRVQLQTSGGPREKHFTANPEFSFYNSVYRRTLSYSKETFDVEADNVPDFGSRVRFRLPQNGGDVLTNLAFRLRLPAVTATYGWIESVAHALVEWVEIQIGEVPVQRLTSDFLQIHSEHYVTQTKQKALYNLIGKYPERSADLPVSSRTILHHLGGASGETDWRFDIPFWFYGHERWGLPLCAILNKEVHVVVKLRDVGPLVQYDNGVFMQRPDVSSLDLHLKEFTLEAEVGWVDGPERIRLQNTSTDFVITQIQQESFFIDAGETELKVATQFVHPVKELYFVIQREDLGQLTTPYYFCSPFDYDNIVETNGADPAVEYGKFKDGELVLFEHLRTLKIRLDDDVILDEITGGVNFLKAVQSGIHHSKTQLIRRFYSYAFGLDPEHPRPSGSVDFTPIRNQVFEFTLNPNPDFKRNVRIYALSHNILRVKEGDAHVLFQSR